MHGLNQSLIQSRLQRIPQRLGAILKRNTGVFPWLSLLTACGLLIQDSSSLRPWILDDALIFLRYVQTFMDGHGFVYNAGAPPVEGYTSFLWLLTLTGAGFLHFDLVQTSIVLGYFFSIACLCLLTVSHKFVAEIGWPTRFLAPLFVVATRTYSPWARSGMEVPLFSLLILLFFLNHARISHKINAKNPEFVFQGVLAVLLLMTRPEGFLMVGLSFIDLVWLFWKTKKKSLLVWGMTIVLLYVPYFFWRYDYYGFIFPNTFYVKVGDGFDMLQRGSLYVRYFILEYLPLIFLLALSPWYLRTLFSRLRLGLLISFILAFTAYVSYVGGDYLGAFRFFAPIVPLCVLAASRCLERLAMSLRLFAVMVFLILPQQWFASQNVHDHVLATSFIARDGKIVGEWLKKNMPPETTFATNSAGAIAYYSGLYTIDMLGLNDKHIAHTHIPYMGHGTAGHEKGNGPYVLLQRPDFIQFGPPLGRFTPELVGDAEINRSPSFKELYEEQEYPISKGKTVKLYKRKDVDSPVPTILKKEMVPA